MVAGIPAVEKGSSRLLGLLKVFYELNMHLDERLVKIYEKRTFVFTDKWVNFINHLHNLTRADCNL